MELVIEVEPGNPMVALDFVGGDTIEYDKWELGPQGVRYLFPAQMERRSFEQVVAALIIVVEVSKDVSVQVLSEWIASKLHRPKTKIRINRKAVTEITAESIRITIEETTEIER